MPRSALLPLLFSLFAGLFAACASAPRGGPVPETRPVVLLHGLALSTASMNKIREALERDGRLVCPVDYPSRDYPIDTLVTRFVAPAIHACVAKTKAEAHDGTNAEERDTTADTLDFVTHSMGGILVRALSARPGALAPHAIGRVVMIAPPNRGSEVVDSMAGSWWFGGLLDAWGGPAGHELGTDSSSMPNHLARSGPPAFTFGVIAGTKSFDPLFSEWIKGRDDGKVSVENTKLAGMKDFIEIPASHTVILWKDETVRQVRAFLRDERFER